MSGFARLVQRELERESEQAQPTGEAPQAVPPRPAVPARQDPLTTEARATTELLAVTKSDAVRECLRARWCGAFADIASVITNAEPDSPVALALKAIEDAQLDQESTRRLLKALLSKYEPATAWLRDFLTALRGVCGW